MPRIASAERTARATGPTSWTLRMWAPRSTRRGPPRRSSPRASRRRAGRGSCRGTPSARSRRAAGGRARGRPPGGAGARDCPRCSCRSRCPDRRRARSRRDPGGLGDAHPLGEEAADLADEIVVVGSGLHGQRASPSCASGRRRHRTWRRPPGMAGSKRKALVSLTMSAPASRAARATAALVVSTEMKAGRLLPQGRDDRDDAAEAPRLRGRAASRAACSRRRRR